MTSSWIAGQTDKIYTLNMLYVTLDESTFKSLVMMRSISLSTSARVLRSFKAQVWSQHLKFKWILNSFFLRVKSMPDPMARFSPGNISDVKSLSERRSSLSVSRSRRIRTTCKYSKSSFIPVSLFLHLSSMLTGGSCNVNTIPVNVQLYLPKAFFIFDLSFIRFLSHAGVVFSPSALHCK